MKFLYFYSFPRRIKVCCWIAAFLFLALTGCNFSETKPESTAAGGESLTLMTWNVQNLFDGNDNGYEYDEFKESAGWSTEKYKGRLNSISSAICKIDPRPDIIVFQEIESLKILEDLSSFISYGYDWSHFANNHGASLGLGVLSRLPLLEPKVHSVIVNGETTPRPVLEVHINTGKETFVIFACHWKSKLGDDDVTERTRRASARVIVRRIRELREKEPNFGVIVTGDLNENYDEFFRQNAKTICALLPDDPYCAKVTGCVGPDNKKDAGRQKDFFVISKNRPPESIHFPQESVVLYSPWLNDLENGTYYYKHNWETIDHFLISGQFFNNTGWEYEKAMIVNSQPFTNSSGTPASYNMRSGIGLSDHLPLIITLKLVVPESAPSP